MSCARAVAKTVRRWEVKSSFAGSFDQSAKVPPGLSRWRIEVRPSVV